MKQTIKNFTSICTLTVLLMVAYMPNSVFAGDYRWFQYDELGTFDNNWDPEGADPVIPRVFWMTGNNPGVCVVMGDIDYDPLDLHVPSHMVYFPLQYVANGVYEGQASHRFDPQHSYDFLGYHIIVMRLDSQYRWITNTNISTDYLLVELSASYQCIDSASLGSVTSILEVQ